MSLWGWSYYSVDSQHADKSSWGSELELDVTKTFFNRLSIATDAEFIDYDDQIRGDLEQLFASFLILPDNGTVITGGKFNSPIGVEGRDFWDRYTGTPSLLFRAQPEDLRGVMLTAPIGQTHITLRPFLVSGFDDDTSIPDHPSGGLMVEYRPSDKLTLNVTNWFGPGLAWSLSGSGAGSGYTYGSSSYARPNASYGSSGSYASSVYELTDEWNSPDYSSNGEGSLYFFNVNATWKPAPGLTLQAEYLLGSGEVHSTLSYWDGIMLLANYNIDDHWHVFAQYSFLDDATGTTTWIKQRLQEVNGGFGYHFDSHWEFRTEYRHDFSDENPDIDSVWFNITFGY